GFVQNFATLWCSAGYYEKKINLINVILLPRSASANSSASQQQDVHQATTLVRIFNQVFATTYRTLLEAGGDEPLYQPASEPAGRHRIVFTRDYFASALHEVAHWCIAGP